MRFGRIEVSRPPGDGEPGGGKPFSAAEHFLSLQEPLVENVRHFIVENNLEVIIAGASDLNGIFIGKRIPAVRFAERPLASAVVSDVFWILDAEHRDIPAPNDSETWWPAWDRGFADLDAFPDLSTFRVVPWLDRTGLVLCEHFFPDGRAIDIAPKNVLRRVLRRAESVGTVKFAAELEFFLFQETEETIDEKGYRPLALRTLTPRPRAYGIQQGTTDEHVMRPLVRSLEAFGIPIEYWNPEVGPGQYEVNMVYSDLPEAADRAFLFKHAVKEVAAQHDLTATFMAKPLPGLGSSCHLHQSLWKEKQNLFWAGERGDHLSDLALRYIGGSVAALAELMLPLAPNLNSYKRLVPHSAAGTTATWSYDNRTTGLRILNQDANNCRVENRVGGADVNPYLAMAASLAGGLHGIEHGGTPPAPFGADAYSEPSLTQLPASLDEAIAAFEASAVAKDFFGEEFVRFYAHTRKWELEQFRANVTDWEVRRYFLSL